MGGAVKSVTKPVANVVSDVPVVGKPVAGIISGAGDIAGGALDAVGLGGVPKASVQNVNIERGGPIDPRAGKLDKTFRNITGARAKRESRLREAAVTDRRALLRQLQQQAAGRGPSIAEAQLKQAQDRNLAQQLAAAGRAQGGNAAALQRQLARQQAASGQDIAQQAMVARMQEAQQAQQQIGQMTAQDQQLAGQLAQQYAQQGLTFDVAQQQARAQLAQMKQNEIDAFNRAQLQQQATQAGLASGIAGAQAQQQAGTLGALGTLGAGLATAGVFSDKNVKKNIKPANMKKDFLDHLSASSYEYKEPSKPGRGKGEFASVMAQELEKSKVGRSMVMDTPEGKMVDYGKGFGAILAAQAELNKRLEAIEGKRKKSKK